MKTSMVTCGEVAGTGSAALLLFSVVYWWPRAKVTVRGKRWIAKARVSWRKEIKLSRNQFDRGLAKLKRLGVIETSSHKFAGPTPILHVRLTPSGISRLSTSPEDGPDFLESENSDFLESEKVHTQKPTIQKQKDLSSKDHGMTSSPGKEPPMPFVKDKILSSPKAEKKHMNAGACEVKPLHLQRAFRKLCAEHWPGHWTGVPSPKEMNQWKHWIAHCGGNHPGHVLDCVLNNWIDFAKGVSAATGTNSVAPKPSPGFLLLNCTTAVNFFLSQKADAKPKSVSQPKKSSHFVPQLQLIANSDKNKPATCEEVMAILEDDE